MSAVIEPGDGVDHGRRGATLSSESPLKIRDFRLLWAGEAISGLGDQFTIVALPWLALLLTGSGLALGAILAVMAIPRAILMLAGGVYVDRFSPRRMMVAANALRLGAVTALGVAVLSGSVALWMLFAFGLVYGVADALFFPAQNSIVPSLVDERRLQQANSIVQGTGQLALFVGPAVAGLFVVALGASGDAPTVRGLGAALLVDAITFAFSLATLGWIRGGSLGGGAAEPMVGAIRTAVRFVWASPSKRFVLLFIMAINLLIVGPLTIAIPLLEYARLPEGAAAFGVILSALGGGSLVGMIAAGALPAPRPALLGPTVLGVLGVTGVGLAAMALASSTAFAATVAATMGVASGYANVLLVTWMQRRVPRALMGRVVSLIGLASLALVPVSQLVAGAMVQVSLEATLFTGGAGLALVALVSAFTQPVRSMGLERVVTELPA